MKRIRFQFGLRPLLALVVAIAIGLGGWRYWKSTREQRAITSAIRACPEFSPAEQELLCSMIWGQRQHRPASSSGDSDPWLHGTWQTAAYWHAGELGIEPGVSGWRFSADKAEHFHPWTDHGTVVDEYGCTYSQTAQHNRFDTRTDRYAKLISTYSIYDGSDDLLLLLIRTIPWDVLSDEERRGFARDPYPAFHKLDDDLTHLLILRRQQ